MEIFARLGDRIAARWNQAARDERSFAAIAEECLQAEAPHLDLTLPALAEWALFSDSLPAQWSRPFGQPPLNLYNGTGFYIEANLWLDSTTTIHQHGFSGAFCMLIGRSLHGLYTFHEEERINAQLRLGRCAFVSAELLAPRMVRRIDAGSQLIHSAFHLDRPSVSIVVRTEAEPEAGPQLDYLPPFVAVDPRPDREPLRTQLELLDMLAETHPAQHLAALERLVASENRYLVYRVLARAFARLGQDASAWAALESCAARHHPDFVPRICESLREARRQDELVAHRSTLRREEDRLLLALLIALPSRAAIHSFLESMQMNDSKEEWIVQALNQTFE